MLTLDQIKKELTDRNLAAVSKKSGVPYHTVIRVMNGETENPKYQTVKALSDYLEGKRD